MRNMSLNLYSVGEELFGSYRKGLIIHKPLAFIMRKPRKFLEGLSWLLHINSGSPSQQYPILIWICHCFTLATGISWSVLGKKTKMQLSHLIFFFFFLIFILLLQKKKKKKKKKKRSSGSTASLSSCPAHFNWSARVFFILCCWYGHRDVSLFHALFDYLIISLISQCVLLANITHAHAHAHTHAHTHTHTHTRTRTHTHTHTHIIQSYTSIWTAEGLKWCKTESCSTV